MTLVNRFRSALLAFVLLPLLAVAVTPGAASAQATTRYLKLVSLQCITTEDWTGADEPYLNVGGNTVWSGSLNDSQSANLTGLSATPFFGQIEIELYDDDSPDGDDWLGTGVAHDWQAGSGYQTIYFTQDGARYKLTYYVY